MKRLLADHRDVLLGREHECAVLDRVLADVRAGTSGALVLRGEAGVGKSALLDHLVDAAADCRVACIAGVQSEMELPYAGLQQLVAQLPDRTDALPEPQRAALGAAFGLTSGVGHNRYLVDLAALTLFAEVAREKPLVCVVDDAQWLDRATVQALAFVARRLRAESVALVFARRTGGAAVDETEGLDELVVEGLNGDAARALLREAVPGRLDEEIITRLVAEAHGNPLALLELPRGALPDVLAGGFGLAGGLSVVGPVERTFAQRILALPWKARGLMLLAAADPTGDSSLLWRAAALREIPAASLLAAEEDGLIAVTSLVRFRHPLVRSAAYRVATPDERRAAHRALAEATDPEHDPDRRAWHRAFAAAGPDEEVAQELERSAARAQARGGLFAAAAFLERAVDLTLDPRLRGRRALLAAQVKDLAGGQDSALELVRIAEASPLDATDRAAALHLRGRVALTVERGPGAARQLLAAAELMAEHDASRAREIHLEALTAAVFMGDLTEGVRAVGLARAALEIPRPAPGDATAPDAVLDALATLLALGPAAAAGPIKGAVRALDDDAVPAEISLRWMWLACRLSIIAYDEDGWLALLDRGGALARESGSFVALGATLSSHAAFHAFTGDLGAAVGATREGEQIWESIGIRPPQYAAGILAAWFGDEAAAEELYATAEPLLRERGEGIGLAMVHWSRAVLCNSRGRYAEALEQAETASRFPRGVPYVGWALSEAVEAAARCGEVERGRAALESLAACTASGTGWARGIETRARALLADEETAEDWYQQSVAHLEGSRMRAELARSRLVYGEWLRRQRRRLDARRELTAAYEVFAGMGATGFAERAVRELSATGARAPRGDHANGRARLSAQEARIAELASTGLSNAEIATVMFISASTVDYHLRKIFRKLDVTSRTQLHLALRDPDRPPGRPPGGHPGG